MKLLRERMRNGLIVRMRGRRRIERFKRGSRRLFALRILLLSHRCSHRRNFCTCTPSPKYHQHSILTPSRAF